MRRAILGAAALLAGAAVLAGCGGANHLKAVSVEPPAGSRVLGKTGRQRSSSDPPTGIPLYRLRPRAGNAISYAVTVRSSSDDPIVVTGVEGDGGEETVEPVVLNAHVELIAPRRGECG